MNLEPSKVLVVDDFEPNRRVLCRRLGRAGFEVLTAASGNEALDVVARERIDLILLDVMMPGVDGLTVLETLRESHSDVELPVIMVTAMTQSADVVTALHRGANDYVTKPIDFPVLLARVNTQLSRRQAMKALQESEERYALAMRGANDGLWDWNLKTGALFLSPRWKSQVGYQPAELEDDIDTWRLRIHPKDLMAVEKAWKAHLVGETEQFECEYRLRHRDGSYRWMLGRGLCVRDTEAEPVRFAGSQSDTTDGKVMDPLTGLPNRLLFLDRLERAIMRSQRREDYRFAVLFLDLDRFKLVNDSLGHHTGDLLLVEIAKRLKRCMRRADTVARRVARPLLARLGGDEFTILLDDIECAEDATRVANRIQRVLTEPYTLEGQEVCTTASVGIALSTPAYQTPEEFLRDADNAMYRAKAKGGARHEVFDTAMHDRAMRRLQLESELRKAADQGQFQLYYQPIIDLRTMAIAEFEALIRWHHPERGLVSPLEFVPVAEETGLIHEIGAWVFEEACRQLRSWHDQFDDLGNLRVSVNLSRVQLQSPELVARFGQILRLSGVDASYITLEITESVVMDRTQGVADVLEGLQDLGMKLVMDDFGTGFSSLSLLSALPFAALKIDRSFVSRMETAAKEASMVTTIVQLAHNLGLDVVAEGVETDAQWQHLQALGCEYAQGYLFARPADGQACTEELLRGAWRERSSETPLMQLAYR